MMLIFRLFSIPRFLLPTMLQRPSHPLPESLLLRHIYPQEYFLYRFQIHESTEVSVFRHRNHAGLLRYNDYQRIGHLRHAQTRSMPRAQISADILFFRKRENAAGCMNPVSANDYGTVMQRRSFVKQISQKAHRNPGIHNGPGFNNIIQHGFPFKNNQCPGPGSRKIIHRCHNFLYHFNSIFLVQASELTGNDVPTSQLLQPSTQFRLEQAVYERMSLEDRMTGLKNRKAFEKCLEKIQDDSLLLENALLLFIDIAGLKEINDTYGMQLGDEAVIRTARSIQTAGNMISEQQAECFRIDGDEFAVVVSDPQKLPSEWIRLIKAEMENETPGKYHVRLKFGYSYLRKTDGVLNFVSDWKQQADRMQHYNKEETAEADYDL